MSLLYVFSNNRSGKQIKQDNVFFFEIL